MKQTQKYTIVSEDGKHTVSRHLTEKQVKEMSALGYSVMLKEPRGKLVADYEQRVLKGMRNQNGSPTLKAIKDMHGPKWAGNHRAGIEASSFHRLVMIKTETAKYLVTREQFEGVK